MIYATAYTDHYIPIRNLSTTHRHYTTGRRVPYALLCMRSLSAIIAINSELVSIPLSRLTVAPEQLINHIHVSTVPGNFYRVANGSLDTAGGSRVFLSDGWVQFFGYSTQKTAVCNQHCNCVSHILVAFNMGGNTDFANDISYLSIDRTGFN